MLIRMGKVWFIHPEKYIKQVIESGQVRLFWFRGSLNAQRLDPHGFAKLFCLNTNYEYMILEEYGLTHWKEGAGQIATYPSWDYIDDDFQLLSEMCANPAGQDLSQIQNMKIPGNHRPRLGQDHMIVVTKVPSMSTNLAKKFYIQLTEFASEYNVKFFLPSVTSYRLAFGLGFGGASMDPSETALRNTIILPSGKVLEKKDIRRYPMWTRIFGHSPHQLESSPEARLSYNIGSMLYAEQNFLKLMNFKANAPAVETNLPMAQSGLPEAKNKSPLAGVPQKLIATGIDKVNCDTCSLANGCKYARDGAVCAVPNSDGVSLSTYFNTRDADRIVDGLGTLNGMLAKRLERKVNVEDVLGEDDPEILRLASTLFRQGSELAKLLDPNLRGGTKVQVNVGTQGGPVQVTQLGNANPAELMASIVRALEAQGIPRAQQTPKMVENFIKAMGEDSQTNEAKYRAIEQVANTVDAVQDLIPTSNDPE